MRVCQFRHSGSCVDFQILKTCRTFQVAGEFTAETQRTRRRFNSHEEARRYTKKETTDFTDNSDKISPFLASVKSVVLPVFLFCDFWRLFVAIPFFSALSAPLRLITSQMRFDFDGPLVDAAGEALGLRKALLAEPAGRAEAPAAGVAMDHDVAVAMPR
jgi:hypothetical protein